MKTRYSKWKKITFKNKKDNTENKLNIKTKQLMQSMKNVACCVFFKNIFIDVDVDGMPHIHIEIG